MSVPARKTVLVAACAIGLLVTPFLHAQRGGRPVESAKDSRQERPDEAGDDYVRRMVETNRQAALEHARIKQIPLVAHYTEGVKGYKQYKVENFSLTLLSADILPADLNRFVGENLGKTDLADGVAEFVRALAISGIYDDILEKRHSTTKPLAEVLRVPGRPGLLLKELFSFLRYSVRRGDPEMEAWLRELTLYTLSPDAQAGFVDKPRDVGKAEPGRHGHPIHHCIPSPPNPDLATMDEDDGVKCER